MDLGVVDELFEYKSGEPPLIIDIGHMHTAFLLDKAHREGCFVAYNLTITRIDGQELDE